MLWAGIILLAQLYVNFSKIAFNFILLVQETAAHIPPSQILDTLGKEELVLACEMAVVAFWGMCMCPGSVYLS